MLNGDEINSSENKQETLHIVLKKLTVYAMENYGKTSVLAFSSYIWKLRSEFLRIKLYGRLAIGLIADRIHRIQIIKPWRRRELPGEALRYMVLTVLIISKMNTVLRWLNSMKCLKPLLLKLSTV